MSSKLLFAAKLVRTDSILALSKDTGGILPSLAEMYGLFFESLATLLPSASLIDPLAELAPLNFCALGVIR